MQSAAVRMQSAKAARAALVSKLALATAIGSPQYQQLLDQESFLKGYIQELAFSLHAAQAKGPVRRLLAAMDALRLPEKWRRSPPNFDRIFEPYPPQLEVNVPSVPDFWYDVVGRVSRVCRGIADPRILSWWTETDLRTDSLHQ